MTNVAKILDSIDKKVFECMQIVDHFEEMEQSPEMNKKRLLQHLSKTLASIDFDHLAILKEMQLSPDLFNERRSNIIEGF